MSQFELETAVTRLEENLWRGELHKGWRIGYCPLVKAIAMAAVHTTYIDTDVVQSESYQKAQS